MTGSTPDLVVSGVPYTVVDLEGGEPADLEGFVGERSFAVQGATGRHEVHGDGFLDAGGVRFHEKADDGGRDVRVWQITRAPTGGFAAQTV